MTPSAQFTKTDGNTGVVSPSSIGICAIIAPCSGGVANQPASATKTNLVLSSFGHGILTEFAAYMLARTGKPCVLVKATASTAGTYGALVFTGTGTSVATAGATAPIDSYDVLIKVVNGGVRGTDGITYTYSLDGGLTASGVQSLGVATSIVIPDSGVTIALAAGTLVAGDTIAVPTTGPRLTTGDLTNALEALRTSSLSWEFVLVGGHDGAKASVDLLDTWLAAREAEGKYRAFAINARVKTAGETEAAYLTAMTTAWSATASIRGCVGADGGDVTSAVPGRAWTQKRPTSLALVTRLMSIPYGVDAAYVGLGPIPGFGLADAAGNPKNHDESYYPGLDNIRLVTLRTFERRNGTYINNPNTIATAGSDYVYAQHIRTMNRACELSFDVVTSQLSIGIQKSPKKGPLGEVYIAEEDAQKIDDLVNQSLAELVGQVSALRFRLSRLDNIGANGPITLTGAVEIVSLAYAKQFNVTAGYVRTISVAA